MEKKLTFRYNRAADILYVDTCHPYVRRRAQWGDLRGARPDGGGARRGAVSRAVEPRRVVCAPEYPAHHAPGRRGCLHQLEGGRVRSRRVRCPCRTPVSSPSRPRRSYYGRRVVDCAHPAHSCRRGSFRVIATRGCRSVPSPGGRALRCRQRSPHFAPVLRGYSAPERCPSRDGLSGEADVASPGPGSPHEHETDGEAPDT